MHKLSLNGQNCYQVDVPDALTDKAMSIFKFSPETCAQVGYDKELGQKDEVIGGKTYEISDWAKGAQALPLQQLYGASHSYL